MGCFVPPARCQTALCEGQTNRIGVVRYGKHRRVAAEARGLLRLHSLLHVQRQAVSSRSPRYSVSVIGLLVSRNALTTKHSASYGHGNARSVQFLRRAKAVYARERICTGCSLFNLQKGGGRRRGGVWHGGGGHTDTARVVKPNVLKGQRNGSVPISHGNLRLHLMERSELVGGLGSWTCRGTSS